MKTTDMIRPMTCPVCDKLIPAASGCGADSDIAGVPGDDNRRIAGVEGLSPKFAGSLPFCSERCRKIDLFRWFDGRYAIVDELSPDSSISTESDVDEPDEYSNDIY